MYPGAVIALKLDSDGCFVAADGHTQHYPTVDTNVVDTTGAGDAFDGAFLARYLRDGDLAAAAQFANRIGGWVVSRDGARPPADDELRQILAP
jgi:sugar/nucleoside kinase (ribokinase family)